MEFKGRARYARAIAQVARALELDGISIWLGGEWAKSALDGASGHVSREAQFYVFADQASDVRSNLEDLGYEVVNLTPTSFVTVRGAWRVRWELLWHDEQGQVVSYDEQDRVIPWPEDAFSSDKRVTVGGASLPIVDPEVQALRDQMVAGSTRQMRKKDDLSRMKAFIQDRM